MFLKRPLWLCQLTAVLLVSIGVLLNQIVISANGGLMPVDTGCIGVAVDGRTLDERHKVMTDTTEYRYLGDVIPVDVPVYGGIFSMGDMVLFLGLALSPNGIVLDRFSTKWKSKVHRKAGIVETVILVVVILVVIPAIILFIVGME